MRSRKGLLKVIYSPRRSLQRRKLKSKKKKDNCGNEIFEKASGDGINTQVEGLCFDRSRATIHFNNRERRKYVYRCRLDIRFGSGKKREFSSDCLYFLSELGMRRETPRRFEESKI